MVKTASRIIRPGRAKCIPEDPDKILLPFQARWVNDRARLKLAEKSRQIGWTWGDALDTVQELAKEHKAASAGSKLDTWITSRDDFQAKLYLEDCKKWAQFLDLGADAVGEVGETVLEWTDSAGKKQKSNAYMLPFTSGGRAFSLSSNEDAQAGKRGSRKLDEFALHPRQRRLFGIAQPGITWGGQLAVFSTHRGSHAFFNHLIKEIREGGNPKNWSYHRVTLEDALNQGLLYKLQSKLPEEDLVQLMDETDYFNHIKKEAADEETFLEEYMCVPSDDSSAFLSFELIDAAKYSANTIWDIPTSELGREVYMGVDVGRHSDLTVIWILERRDGMWFTRKVERLHKCEYELQHQIISNLILEYRVRRCCIDRTGIGDAPSERLQRRFRGTVEGIYFTAESKEILATPIRMLMEQHTLKIPDDRKITNALRKVRREATTTDNWRFVANDDKDGHADEFWALGLAIHAGMRPQEMHKPRRVAMHGESRILARSSRRLPG